MSTLKGNNFNEVRAFMFYASCHQRRDQAQNVNDIAIFEQPIPKNMILHSTFVYIEEGYFQCLWEASDVYIIQHYITTTLGDVCLHDYYSVDPITAIA